MLWPGARGDFVRDGYTVIPEVVDKALIAHLRDHLEHLMARFPGIPTEHLHHVIYRNDPFWVRVVSDPRLLDCAAAQADFLKEGIALFSSNYFCKQPRTGKSVLWHQDGSYWALRPMNVCTIWLAVDYSGPENGGMQVVRGTHTERLQPLVSDCEEVLNVLGARTHTEEDLVCHRDAGNVLNLILEPGDVAFFHPNIIHGSPPNTSDHRRCGLTIRYISPEVLCTDPAQPVMMLRGEPIPSINRYRSWPPFRPGYDFQGDLSHEWNAQRRIEPTDPEPDYFADTSPDALEAKTGEIRRELENFIGLLGGWSIEENRGKDRKFQAGALTGKGKTIGGVQHMDRS